MRSAYVVLALATLWCASLWPYSDVDQSLLMLFSDDFGYTLVGTKAVSLYDSSYRLRHLPDLHRKVIDYLSRTFAKSNSFIFRKIRQSLWLVNVPEMDRSISKYPLLKSFIIKKFGSVEEFFTTLRCGDQDLFEIFDYQDDLIGIALGYGLDNGRFCNRRTTLITCLRKFSITWGYPFEMFPCVYYVAPLNSRCVTRCIIRIDNPVPSGPFRSLEEEWCWIQQNKLDLDDESIPEIPYYIWLPTYISCKSKEAKRVHKRFVRARSKLAKMFCSKTPSEVIAQEALKK